MQSRQVRPAGRWRGEPRRRRPAWPSHRLWRLGLRVAGAGLLAAAGAIHLDLYLTGYRSIPTIGWLFLLQVITAFALAAAALAATPAATDQQATQATGSSQLPAWFRGSRLMAGLQAGIPGAGRAVAGV